MHKSDSFTRSTTDEEDSKALAPFLRRLYFAIGLTLFAVLVKSAVPNVQDIRDAYVTQEAGKLVSAENAKIVAEEILKRVDKALAK